jgi:hypothetical protein
MKTPTAASKVPNVINEWEIKIRTLEMVMTHRITICAYLFWDKNTKI